MDLSFVILTWNSESYIEKCIDSIFSSLADSGMTFEIFVVDNGSKDSTPEILGAYETRNVGRFFPILLKENVGTTVSRNIALKRARGRDICVMDSDVEVALGVFHELRQALYEDSQIGMVVPKILYPSGRWQKSTDRFPTLGHKFNRFFRLRQMEEREAKSYENKAGNLEVDYAISALWLFRREILEHVGLLDESIFYAPEDVDYCLRVWKTGFRIIYVPNTEVIHHTQEISRGWKLNKAKVEHLKGLIYLFTKHGYFFRSPNFKSA